MCGDPPTCTIAKSWDMKKISQAARERRLITCKEPQQEACRFPTRDSGNWKALRQQIRVLEGRLLAQSPTPAKLPLDVEVKQRQSQVKRKKNWRDSVASRPILQVLPVAALQVEVSGSRWQLKPYEAEQ